MEETLERATDEGSLSLGGQTRNSLDHNQREIKKIYIYIECKPICCGLSDNWVDSR